MHKYIHTHTRYCFIKVFRLQCKKLSIGAWLSFVNGRLMAKSLTLNFSISKTIWWIVLNFHMTLFLTMLISILSSMNLLLYWFLCYFRFMVKQSFGLCTLLLRWIFLKLGRSLPWLGCSLKRFFIIILYFRFSRSRCVATHQSIYLSSILYCNVKSYL